HRLFGLCASRFEDEQYWEEFVKRFNQSLMLSVCQAYRRFSGEAQPPDWVLSELLQEIYLKILKDKCSILRRFRGETELEAEVYLMHIATSVTIDSLRWQLSFKRYVETESLEDPSPLTELLVEPEMLLNPYTDELAERDLIKILRRTITGKNRERNILIFLLHFREGFTPLEIAQTNVFDLSPHTIAHLLDRMRERIRKVMFIEKPG
ncbi:MAG: hypothetical protein L0220_27545, partial [Acidobacteria bacterium]|nr:hypothetical protein [Acidobacteriota bacterium]